MIFNKQITEVFDSYHHRMEVEKELMATLKIEEGMRRRDEFLLPVGVEVGNFLYQMAKAAGSKTILEIGTSYGYSTLWLACAAQETGGKIITLELDPDKVNYAKEEIRKAGLEELVDFRLGDAIQSIQGASDIFDFVLIDIWKELYVPAFQVLYNKLEQFLIRCYYRLEAALK